MPGGLKLARGFGDIDFEEVGYSHDPEVVKTEIQLEEGDQVFVVVGCDGLTEANIVTPEKMGEIISANRDQSPDVIAQALVGAAFNEGKGKMNKGKWDAEGSTDNISTAVFRVGTKPGSATVLDGHGGTTYRGTKEYIPPEKKAADISTAIGRDFYPSLQRSLACGDSMALNQIIRYVGTLKDDYIKLGRKKHLQAIENLMSKIDDIMKNPGIKDKYHAVFEAIEDAFMKEMHKHTKALLPFFSDKEADVFIKKMNNHPDEYHYPRLLATLLKIGYNNDPELLKRTKTTVHKGIIDRVNIVHDKDGVYESKIPALYCQDDEFHKFNRRFLDCSRITPTQVYQLYTGERKLDAQYASLLWSVKQDKDEKYFNDIINAKREDLKIKTPETDEMKITSQLTDIKATIDGERFKPEFKSKYENKENTITEILTRWPILSSLPSVNVHNFIYGTRDPNVIKDHARIIANENTKEIQRNNTLMKVKDMIEMIKQHQSKFYPEHTDHTTLASTTH